MTTSPDEGSPDDLRPEYDFRSMRGLVRGKYVAKLNRAWHEKHHMPPRATLEQRISWYLEHRDHCGCRPIPAKIAAAMKAKGLI